MALHRSGGTADGKCGSGDELFLFGRPGAAGDEFAPLEDGDDVRVAALPQTPGLGDLDSKLPLGSGCLGSRRGRGADDGAAQAGAVLPTDVALGFGMSGGESTGGGRGAALQFRHIC